MRHPLDADAEVVPPVARRQLVQVDGRTFAISDESGQMTAPTHGMGHDDRRHLYYCTVTVPRVGRSDSAGSLVVGHTVSRSDAFARAVLTERRWVASGLREDIHVYNTVPIHQSRTLQIRLTVDFAHVSDVKAGIAARATPDGQASRTRTWPTNTSTG
jgi:N-terminal domain of (some) glycogen debranching enzymes